MDEIEYLKKWPQSFLTDEEKKIVTQSFLSVKIFAVGIGVFHLALLISLVSILKDQSLPILILAVGAVLFSGGIFGAFLWFFFLKKMQLDLQEGRKYEIKGIITGKSFSSNSSKTGDRDYIFQIDDILKINVIRKDYYNFKIGEKIEVKITKNTHLNLSLIKV